MVLIAFLPEIVAFLVFFFVSFQMAEIGPLLVLAQLGLAALLIAVRPLAAMQTFARWWPLLLVPILAFISGFWSEAPAASFRYGAQLTFTAFLAVHLARLITPQRFLAIFLLAAFVFCALSVASPRLGPSWDQMVPIGFTGSKNAMGSAAQILFTAAIAMLLCTGVSRPMRWVALLALPVAAYFLLRTASSTAVVTALLSVPALMGLWLLQRFPPNGRLGVMAAVLIVLTPLSFLIPEGLDWFERFMAETLDKDPTLTGRTLLWAAGEELATRKPLLGYGYQAIWLGESSEAIGLMRLTGMSDGRSFHFHNQFLQIQVDLGYVGLIAFVLMMAAVVLAGFRQVVLRPTLATSYFFLSFLFMLSHATIDQVMNAFSIHTMLLFAAAVYAFAPTPAAAHNAAWPGAAALQGAGRRRRAAPR